VVPSFFFELCDSTHRLAVLGIDLVQDHEKARDGTIGIVERIGEKVRLAHRYRHAVLRRLHEGEEAMEEFLRLLGVATLVGVIGQLEEDLGIVPVLERLHQDLAGHFGVPELVGVDGSRTLAQRLALGFVVDLVAARCEEIGEIGKTRRLAITALDLARIFVVVGIERARILDLKQRAVLVAGPAQERCRFDEQRRLGFGLAGQLGALSDDIRRAIPALGGDE